MGVRGTVGRFVYNVQVAPPSVVLSTDGSCANPVGPTIQQVVAVGQSMANAHHGALAQSAGVLSVQVLPPSVVSATAGPPVAQVVPVTQQTVLVAHDSASIRNVDGNVAWRVQVRPAVLVTRAACPMPTPLLTFRSGTIDRQNVVPGTHDTGSMAPASWTRDFAMMGGTVAMVQSLPDKAAWAGVASPIAVTMDAPAASAPSAQLGLFVSFIWFRPQESGKWRSKRRARDHQAAGCSS